jgi:hypothetical protein
MLVMNIKFMHAVDEFQVFIFMPPGWGAPFNALGCAVFASRMFSLQ